MISILYAVLALALILGEVLRTRLRKVDSLSFFSAAYLIAYAMPGAFGREMFRDTNVGVQAISFLVVALFYGLLFVTYVFFKPAGSEKNQVYNKWGILNERYVFVIGVVCCGIAGISALIYSYNYGGLGSAISQAAAIRSGYVEAGPYVFFKRFLPASHVAVISAAWLLQVPGKRSSGLILLGISLPLMVVCGMLLASRGFYVIGFIAVFLLILEKRSVAVRSVALIGAALGLAIFLIYGKFIFASFSSGVEGRQDIATYVLNRVDAQADSNLQRFASDFSHPLKSLHVVVETGAGRVFMFRDIISGVLTLIPSAIFEWDYSNHDIAVWNTFKLTGIHASTIPPGIVAYSVYSISILGVVILPLLLALGLRKVDHFLSPSARNTSAYYYLFVIVIAYRLIQGEPRVFLHANFVYLILFIFLAFKARSCRLPRGDRVPLADVRGDA